MAESGGLRLLEGHRRWFWVTAVLVAGLDQISKYALAQPAEAVQSQMDLLPFLRLVRRPLNTQGPFSLGPHSAIFYIIATAAGLLLIFYLFLDAHPRHLLPIVALGMLCGGAAGNLIDRLAMGGVRDFIDVHWMGRSLWPTFNLADTAICIGVGLILLSWKWAYSHRQAKAPPEKPG